MYEKVAVDDDLIDKPIQVAVDDDLVDKPIQIFNMDETGLPMDHRPPKIIIM